MSPHMLSPVFRLASPRPLPFVPLRALPPPAAKQVAAPSMERPAAVRSRSQK